MKEQHDVLTIKITHKASKNLEETLLDHLINKLNKHNPEIEVLAELCKFLRQLNVYYLAVKPGQAMRAYQVLVNHSNKNFNHSDQPMSQIGNL